MNNNYLSYIVLPLFSVFITVVPYDKKWPAEFIRESIAIHAAFEPYHVKMHHIGSTAVPGLRAKPIIDVLMEVKSLRELDRNSTELESIGYESMGEMGIAERRYFRKGGDHRTHQIHAFRYRNPNIVRHIAFRDYLRTHPLIAHEYGNLKTKVAKSCNHDIAKYSAGKNEFIKYHEELALKWHQNQSTQ